MSVSEGLDGQAMHTCQFSRLLLQPGYTCPKWPYRVPDNVVVHLLGAVDANDAKDHEDHGPGIHQRPHCWLPTACVHTRVEAKGGRDAGLGHCRGGVRANTEGRAQASEGPLGPPRDVPRQVPLSLGTKKKPLVGPSGLELSRHPGGATHRRPWKGGL